MTVKEIFGEHVDALARETATALVRFTKKQAVNRKTIVIVFAYALRAALDELSPDERAVCLSIALDEVQR